MTTTAISFAPTLSATAALADPLVTALPATVTLALESVTVGVSFTCVTALFTVAAV